MTGFVDFDGKISTYLLGSSSLRSFDQKIDNVLGYALRSPLSLRLREIIALLLVVVVCLTLLLPSMVSALATSGSTHDPIVINGDDQFTLADGVIAGSGTRNDPYIIGGWIINDTITSTAIRVENTDAYFVVRDVTVHCSFHCLTGVLLRNLENGVVTQSIVLKGSSFGLKQPEPGINEAGVAVYNSDRVMISQSLIGADGAGVDLNMSSRIRVLDNQLSGSIMLRGQWLENIAITGNTGDGESGMLLSDMNNVLVARNIASAHDPFSIGKCTDTIVTGNTAMAYNDGIVVYQCEDVLLSHNTVTPRDPTLPGSDTGITLMQSTGIVVRANNVTNNLVGIALRFDATGNVITRNLISHNQCGIETDASTIGQNSFRHNVFVANVQDYCTVP